MKAKKLSALMLVLMVAFILCSCQKEEKIVAYINYAEELEESRPDVYSIAAADKYLAEQGYSQEFLESAGGTIFRSTSISSLTDGYDDMRQFVEGSGHHPVSGDARIGYTFTVNKNWMFGKWFPQESGGEGYGVYAMDADNGRGSYSATLVRFINGEDINYGAEHVAEASYSHGNGGEPVTVRCKFND